MREGSVLAQLRLGSQCHGSTVLGCERDWRKDEWDKHTPGPWKVSLADDAVVVTDRTDIIQERAKLDYEEHVEEYEANAELIADAPRLKAVNAELLEELKAAKKLVDEAVPLIKETP